MNIWLMVNIWRKDRIGQKGRWKERRKEKEKESIWVLVGKLPINFTVEGLFINAKFGQPASKELIPLWKKKEREREENVMVSLDTANAERKREKREEMKWKKKSKKRNEHRWRMQRRDKMGEKQKNAMGIGPPGRGLSYKSVAVLLAKAPLKNWAWFSNKKSLNSQYSIQHTRTPSREILSQWRDDTDYAQMID